MKVKGSFLYSLVKFHPGDGLDVVSNKLLNDEHKGTDNKQWHCRASDFFQDWWAEVTHGAKKGGSFSEMMGPSISNKLTSVDILGGILNLHTDTDTCMHICILTADYTVKPVLSGHTKRRSIIA